MRLIRLLSGAGLTLALAANSAWGDDPCWRCPPYGPQPYQQPGQALPALPGQPAQPGSDQAADNAFAQAPATGTGAESIGNPNILGDFLRAGAILNVRSFNSSSSFGSNSKRPIGPIGGGPLKIAENENVRPQDRFFLNYNGYSDILPGVNNTPGGVSHVDYQYETAGVEATCLDGNASFGVRFPLFELNGHLLNDTVRVGDVSLVSKFLIASDGPAGDAMSAGLVVTLPTGLNPSDFDGHKIHSTVWQPWWGVVTNLTDDVYFQGFNSLAIPSTRRDATIMFLDGAIGYWAYRGESGGMVTGIVPTSEVHINWPWTNRGEHNTSHAINVPSSIDLTEGVHILFGHATLQLGVSFCVSGPRLYDVEGIAQLNIPF